MFEIHQGMPFGVCASVEAVKVYLWESLLSLGITVVLGVHLLCAGTVGRDMLSIWKRQQTSQHSSVTSVLS